ncbi:MAG: biotin/lipoyl-containing protein, partial [bacterium]
MTVSVTMPRLGESVTEGTVTRWLKQEGERVEVDEPLLEVSTDKVDTEVPSPAAGVLQSIRVAEDETVEIGVELAIIGDGASDAAAPAQDASGGTDAASADTAPAGAGDAASGGGSGGGSSPAAAQAQADGLPVAPQPEARQADAPQA